MGWRRNLRNSDPQIIPSLSGREDGVLTSSYNFGDPRPTFPSGRAAPTPSPTAGAHLPLGPHKAHGSPAEESHRCPAPGPCAQPRPPSRSRSPAAQQQQKQRLKCLIKASGGCGGHAGPAPRPHPGARGATGSAGQRAGGCARGGGGEDRELLPAPGARVRHYLALRLSLDWSNGAAPRSPPPGSREPLIPVRGGRLKGTPRLFLVGLCRRDSRGCRSSPGPRASRSPSPRPRDVGPQAPRPPRAPRQDRQAASAAPRGDLVPAPGKPASAPSAETRAVRAGAGGSECHSGALGSRSPPWQLAPRHPGTQVLGKRACSSWARHTFPHLPARPSSRTRAHNEIKRSLGLLVYSAAINTPA